MLRWRKISAVAIAASLCTVLLVVILPRSHHKIDLARSTSSDHARFLEETQEEEPSPTTLDQLRQVASRTLQGTPPIPASTPPGHRLLKVGRCTLDGVPVAYLIVATNDELASLFLMDRAELQRFPDAAALLAQQPAGVTCQVGDRSFFMTGTSSVVACGIGHLEPDALRDLVHWLLPY